MLLFVLLLAFSVFATGYWSFKTVISVLRVGSVFSESVVHARKRATTQYCMTMVTKPGVNDGTFAV